ncbi:uncharacterized protein LOC123005014 [Tribolium madens]|uniref:uncharacterized protein LOC123005014 n=1 Tax=Tribolium madens TaxID=41895 RepID=UPI001CF75B44|nr:uncharacterized protein LOC123005014 [Tribolium madens]
MDLKTKIDDFRQLQAHRKLQRNKKKVQQNNGTKIKMPAFNALIKAEELPTYQADITVTLGASISIIEQHPFNYCHPRRSVLFISHNVETYDSDENTIEIKFKEYSKLPDTQIMFVTVGERQEFEVAFRTFMGYRLPSWLLGRFPG